MPPPPFEPRSAFLRPLPFPSPPSPSKPPRGLSVSQDLELIYLARATPYLHGVSPAPQIPDPRDTPFPSVSSRLDLFDYSGAAIPNDLTSLMSYSSTLTLSTPGGVEGATDENLIWLAKTGYEDMVTAYNIIATRKAKGVSVPAAMVVSAWGQ